MCLHSKAEIERALSVREEGGQWGVVWWELNGVPRLGADCVEFRNSGDVASALQWLKECHPDEFQNHGPDSVWTANLSDINGRRAAEGLLLIDEHGNELPGEAQVAGFITGAERGAAHA